MATALKISIINHSTEEVCAYNDTVVIKGVVDQEEEEEEEDENVEEGQNWSKEVKIVQNATIDIPFLSDGKAFVFVTTLTPGPNKIEFVDKDKNCLKKLNLRYEPDVETSEFRRSIVPVLLVCRDQEENGADVQDAIKKIGFAVKLVQAFYEEKLYEHGFEKRTFRVSPKIEVLKLALKMDEMRQMPAEKLWDIVACQIRDSEEIWNPLNKYLGFVHKSCKFETTSDSESPDKIACGGGGLALLGFNSFAVWPTTSASVLSAAFDTKSLLKDSLIETAVQLGLSKSSRTRGNLFCATMGAIAHELGHIFDLGHSQIGLMGKDFYKFHQFLSPVVELQIKCVGCSNMSVGRRHSQRIKPSKISDIVLPHSSATILYHHKFFNESCGFESDAEKGQTILVNKNKVTSDYPLVAVEIRDPGSGLVCKIFELRNNVFELLLSKADIPIECGERACLFAEDSNGNFLKADISRAVLPNTFTKLNVHN